MLRTLLTMGLAVVVASVPVRSVADTAVRSVADTITNATTVHARASTSECEGRDVQHEESAHLLCASEEAAAANVKRSRGIRDMPEDALQLQAIEERDLHGWMRFYSLALGGKDSVQLLSASGDDAEARLDDHNAEERIRRIRRQRRRRLALQALARHAEQPKNCVLLLKHGFLTLLLRLVSPSTSSSALAAGGELTGEENRDILYTIVKMVHHHGDPFLPSCPRQDVAAMENFLVASYHRDRDEDALEELEAKRYRQQQLTRSRQSQDVGRDRGVSEGSESEINDKAQRTPRRRHRGVAPIRSLFTNDELIEPFKHMMETAGDACKHALTQLCDPRGVTRCDEV